MNELVEALAEKVAAYYTFDFSQIHDVVALASLSPSGGGEEAVFPAQLLWDTAVKISLEAAAPVAVAFVGIFLAMELFSLFSRMGNSSGLDTFYALIMTLVRMSLCILCIKNMTGLIGLCFGISGDITSRIGSMITLAVEENLDFSAAVAEQFANERNFFSLLVPWMTNWIGTLIQNGAFVLAKVVCQLRFIEIYIFTALSPVAFCTFVNSEYRSIGIAFLKRLLALGLQGAFILVICFFYVTILNSTLSKAAMESLGPMAITFTMAGYSILLVVALFQTGGWSKSLLQVH